VEEPEESGILVDDVSQKPGGGETRSFPGKKIIQNYSK
jgi:hypothetical protein